MPCLRHINGLTAYGWASGENGVARLVSDIFHEVDEEVRREQLKKLWDRYGNYVAAAAVLLVLAVAAWRAYMWWEAKKAAETGAAFEAAITLAESGKRSEAEAAFADIAGHGTSGYRHLARMREAAELAQTDPKAAIAAYDQIAADGSVGHVLQDLALLRAGALLRLEAQLVDLPQPVRQAPGGDGARAVRAVAVDPRSPVDHDRRTDAGPHPLARRDADGGRHRREQRLRGVT